MDLRGNLNISETVMDKKQIDNRKITILYLTVTVLLTWFCQFMPILIGMDVENTSISSFDYSSVFFRIWWSYANPDRGGFCFHILH